MPNTTISHNGEVHESDALLVSVTDQVIVQGQGVFETLVAYGDDVFAFGRHMDRLENSAGLMGIQTPSRDSVASDIAAALNRVGLEKSRIRLTLTGGIGDRRYSDEAGDPQFFVQVSPAPTFKAFASLATVPFVRNDRGALAGAKTINYGENAVALRFARDAGADEAVFGNTRDLLCEGTWSNIFVFTDGKWITPPLSSGCLPGVTRALVLELGFEIEEADLEIRALTSIDGAFLTSTLRDLQAVGEIDGRKLPLPEPPRFLEMKRAFQKLTRPKD